MKDGIESRDGAHGPQYRGSAYDPRVKRTRKGPWTSSKAAAKAWRIDRLREWRGLGGDSPLFADAAASWLAAAATGEARNRSGHVYKPGVIESYRGALDRRLLPELGTYRLDEITAPLLQQLARRWLAAGLAPSTVRNHLMPLRVIFRDAVLDGSATANPTLQLRLPASKGLRDRVTTSSTAHALIAALAPADAAVWACALFAGLRRGELLALRGVDVDLGAGLVRVERSYCVTTRRFVEPKSSAGLRVVPIIGAFRPFAERAANAGAGLAFGRDATTPFCPRGLVKRARAAWATAGLEPIALHDARHTFASYLIAAMAESGASNPKVVQTLMGHSSIQVTFDRYGHLFPGSEDAARDALDAYLAADARTPGE